MSLRLFRMVPMEATAIPLPTELTTPPVTKIYFDIQGNQAKTLKVYERQHYVGFAEKEVKQVVSLYYRKLIPTCQVFHFLGYVRLSLILFLTSCQNKPEKEDVLSLRHMIELNKTNFYGLKSP